MGIIVKYKLREPENKRGKLYKKWWGEPKGFKP